MPVTYERESRDLSSIAGYSVPEIASWLSDGFSRQDFEGVNHNYKRDFVDANFIAVLWRHSASDIQKRVKEAVVESIAQWSEGDEEVLGDFIRLAGYTRASEAIPSLIRLIDTDMVHNAQGREGDVEVKSWTLAVLQGFAPSKEVHRSFERWLYDPNFDQKHAAQLLMGLVSCAPNDSVRYLNRFFEIEKNMPTNTFGRIDFLVLMIRQQLGDDRFLDVMGQVDPHARERIQLASQGQALRS